MTRIVLFTSITICWFFTLWAAPCKMAMASSTDAPHGRIRPLVVIVSQIACCADTAWPEAEARIRLEFLQSRIQVITVNGTAVSSADRLTELARVADEYNAAAAIRILTPSASPRQAGIDLWINDRITQKTVYRHLPIDDVNANDAPLVAGMKTIELFRGSLQEIHLSNRTVPPLPDPVERLGERPFSSAHHLYFRGGFAGIVASRQTGPRGAPMMGLSWFGRHGLTLHLDGWGALFGRQITHRQDRADLSIYTVEVAPMWERVVGNRVGMGIGLLGGVSVVKTQGISTDLSIGRTARTTVALLGMTTHLRIAITSVIWAVVFADVGTMIPEVNIVFADDLVAQLGRPLFKGGLALAIRLTR